MARPKSTTATKGPAKKSGPKARRGRPPKSATAAKSKMRRKTGKSAAKTPSMTVRIRELRQESRVRIKELKMEVAALKKQLGDAERKEAKLVKVFDAKEKAVAAYGAKWLAKALKTATVKKTRRRKAS
jgi:hypothetical protein